jgi:hypothetical protein
MEQSTLCRRPLLLLPNEASDVDNLNGSEQFLTMKVGKKSEISTSLQSETKNVVQKSNDSLHSTAFANANPGVELEKQAVAVASNSDDKYLTLNQRERPFKFEYEPRIKMNESGVFEVVWNCDPSQEIIEDWLTPTIKQQNLGI